MYWLISTKTKFVNVQPDLQATRSAEEYDDRKRRVMAGARDSQDLRAISCGSVDDAKRGKLIGSILPWTKIQ